METIILLRIIAMVVYGIGIGISYRILENVHDNYSRWMLSIFLWFIVIPWSIGVKITDLIVSAPTRLKHRREKVKNAVKNIKINTIEEYEILKQLCNEFEDKFEANREVDKITNYNTNVQN